MSDLHLVHDCPAWCTVDHASGEPVHLGKLHTIDVPGGARLIEGELHMEPGDRLPQLSLAVDALAWLGTETVSLDHAAAHELIGQLQAFTQRLQQQLDTLQGRERRAKRKKYNPGKGHRQAWREMRLYLAERDGRHCFHCGTEFDGLREATIDHYIPRVLWECSLPANLVLSCGPCNWAKSDRLTWSMAAVLLAWAREGGTGGEAEAPIRAVPAA